jgi:NADH:ubiquinone oxidoreductase subunit 3 (subunit A)
VVEFQFKRLFFIFVFLVLGFFFSFILLGFVYFFYNKKYRVSSISSFERGFVSIGGLQSRFSLHFFLLLIIFIVFDLEVVLLAGLLVGSKLRSFSFFLF